MGSSASTVTAWRTLHGLLYGLRRACEDTLSASRAAQQQLAVSREVDEVLRFAQHSQGPKPEDSKRSSP